LKKAGLIWQRKYKQNVLFFGLWNFIYLFILQIFGNLMSKGKSFLINGKTKKLKQEFLLKKYLSYNFTLP
jgi:hypothetical protein